MTGSTPVPGTSITPRRRESWLGTRMLGSARGLALVGGLILLSTPLVADSAIGLRPEMWAVMALLGTAYWTVAVCTNPERIIRIRLDMHACDCDARIAVFSK